MTSPFRNRRARLLLGLLFLITGIGASGWYLFVNNKKSAMGSELASKPDETSSDSPAHVAIVHPIVGGLPRTCIQPGSVEPFQAADLYAKVSGYLAEQNVDIGSRVKVGDVLARISVPEYEKEVDRNAARVEDAEAKVKQMEAHLTAARAEARAADAAVAFARVLVKSKASFRQYREKQLKRIKELVASQALDERTRDEQEEYFLSALEAENAANESVNAAQEKASAAHAQIARAEADLDEAEAEVGVAKAELAKSKVLLNYSTIRSPYTGVVTKRNFHIGDFIRSADEGGDIPMLAVERTDVMRVVVQVPDRDVPYVTLGAPAVIEVDALPGIVFETHGDNKVGVARWAEAEDSSTRTMRTEIDVPNSDGKLRHGMYGQAVITLTSATKDSLRIPSSSLFGKAEHGNGSVRVVRGGKVAVVQVRYTIDNGLETEILEGLTPTDQVIARSSGPLVEGAEVLIDAGQLSAQR